MNAGNTNFRGGRNGKTSSTLYFNRRKKNQNYSNLHITGGKFVPSEMPPVIISQPWNSCVAMFQVTSKTTLGFLNFSDLKKQMRIQLGFNNAPSGYIDFDVRIESFAMWAVADKTHLVVFPTDFLSNTGIELSRVESNAQRNMFARVGYRFPTHLTITPVSTRGNTVRKIFGYVSTFESICEIHVKILWKGADTVLDTLSVESDYIPVSDSLRSLADKIANLQFESHSDQNDLPTVDLSLS